MFAQSVVPEEPATLAPEAEQLGDLRFRGLLSAADWAKLPPAVRRRFSKRLKGGATAIYTGHVTMCHMSRAGWLFAQALRIIRAPLPLAHGSGLHTVVSVTEEGLSGGQNWTRVYARRSGFPQVIHSTKRFSGPTGLEEYIGFGIRMTLMLTVENGALVFSSAGYFIDIGRLSIALPRWLSPGRTVVTHRETSREQFLFTLDLTHRWLGTLIHQEALYTEVQACPAALS
jgi:hypothetical protein